MKKLSRQKSVKGKKEILVSVDGEFTGKVPGLHSMISLGAVAYTSRGKEISRFKVNLKELSGSRRHPDNMKWWKDFPQAWKQSTKNPVSPSIGMKSFRNWLKKLPGEPKLIGWPLPVDFMFIYWYWWKFINKEAPFGHDGIDIKSVAVSKLGIHISKISRTKVRKRLGIPDTDFSHDSLDDAIQQAKIYFKLLKYSS